MKKSELRQIIREEIQNSQQSTKPENLDIPNLKPLKEILLQTKHNLMEADLWRGNVARGIEELLDAIDRFPLHK